jgi:REP element-mobilizing transposase RayT
MHSLPLAYFISFRTYGTWLHGDERGSVDRHHNVYGTPLLAPRLDWQAYNLRLMKHPPVTLEAARRRAVDAAIRETCDRCGWELIALNVRTNHVHSVVSAPVPPERVRNAFKGYATRRMREEGCWPYDSSPWSRGGSRRYLWTEQEVASAVVYVRDRQGEDLLEE